MAKHFAAPAAETLGPDRQLPIQITNDVKKRRDEELATKQRKSNEAQRKACEAQMKPQQMSTHQRYGENTPGGSDDGGQGTTDCRSLRNVCRSEDKMAIDGETTLLTRRGKAKCTDTNTAMIHTSSASTHFI